MDLHYIASQLMSDSYSSPRAQSTAPVQQVDTGIQGSKAEEEDQSQVHRGDGASIGDHSTLVDCGAVESESLEVSNISQSQVKISLADYLNRKRELNKLISGTNAQDTMPSNNDNMSATDDSDSDSDEGESSDSDTSSEASEGQIRCDMEDDEDEEDGNGNGGVLRTKNELVALPSVEQPQVVRIPDDHPVFEVGTIHAIIDSMVIVQAHEVQDDNQALDIGSILAFQDRHVLGVIFETFGPVHQPFYVMRFNSPNEIDATRAIVGRVVIRSPQFSQLVLTSMVRAFKGSDASNIHDEEVPEEEQEFSDDEQEQMARSVKRGELKRKAQGTRRQQHHQAPDSNMSRRPQYKASSPAATTPSFTTPPTPPPAQGFQMNAAFMEQQLAHLQTLLHPWQQMAPQHMMPVYMQQMLSLQQQQQQVMMQPMMQQQQIMPPQQPQQPNIYQQQWPFYMQPFNNNMQPPYQ